MKYRSTRCTCGCEGIPSYRAIKDVVGKLGIVFSLEDSIHVNARDALGHIETSVGSDTVLDRGYRRTRSQVAGNDLQLFQGLANQLCSLGGSQSTFRVFPTFCLFFAALISS